MGLGQLSDRERAEFFAELDDWLAEIGRSVHALVGPDLLTVEPTELWDLLMAELPPVAALAMTCSECRKFVDRFGGLVTVESDGRLRSVLWDETAAPATFRRAVGTLSGAVAARPIAGIVAPETAVLGRVRSGGFRHLAVVLPGTIAVGGSPDENVKRAVNVGRIRKRLDRLLADTPLEIWSEVAEELSSRPIRTGEAGARQRDEALKLRDLVLGFDRAREHRAWENLLWAVATTATPEFWQFLSGIAASLGDRRHNGATWSALRALWREPVQHSLEALPPLPAVPSASEAERVFEELGFTRALDRRYATAAEVLALWRRPMVS